MDGTPIFDIKPYIPYADCRPDAVGSFADVHRDDGLQVDFPLEFLEKFPPEKRDAVLACLADDPRPSYQDDPDREYSMAFAGLDVKFRVANGVLTVNNVTEYQK